MKIKAVISTVLALTLCLMMLPVSALAGTVGDVDASGKVDATDARLALRAAVGLDVLSEEAKKAADVDLSGKVDATDARLILRAAVGLEKLPEPEKPEEPAVHPEYHEFNTVSLTGAVKCSFADCEAEMPALNDTLNALKDISNGVSYFTGIFEDIAHYDAPELGGTLAEMMGEEEMPASAETSYMPLVVDRLITRNNFHSKNTDFVSSLTDKEAKSIKIERVSTVDFVSFLPEKFSDGRKEYKLSAVKAYDFPEAYKITVVLPEQSFDITKSVSGTSVYDKIYTKDYNDTVEAMRNEVASGFDALSKEMAMFEGMLKMKSSGKITASLVVEFYITADDFTPLAAKYSHMLDVVFDITVTDTIGISKLLTMLQKMDMSSNSYYFFNNNFGM